MEIHGDKTILFAEDNSDDVALPLRALERHEITNEVLIAHDGEEALDLLFGTGRFAERAPLSPELVLAAGL